MKHFKTAVLSLCVFALAFTFLPTGRSGGQVISGFLTTQSYATDTATQLSSYDFVLGAASSPDSDPYVGNLRDAIVQFNIDVCLKHGNGYVSDDGTDTRHDQNGKGILYSTSNVGDKQYGYSTFETAYSSYTAMDSGEHDHMYFSCHGSCFFTWKYFWEGSPYYVGPGGMPKWVGTGAGPGVDRSTTVSTKVASKDEALKILQPGDILWYSCAGGCGSHGKASVNAHSCMFLGTIEIDGHTITNAYRNTGGSSGKKDWCIKPLYNFEKETKHTWYVLSLSKCLQYASENGMSMETQEWVDGIEMPEPAPDDET